MNQQIFKEIALVAKKYKKEIGSIRINKDNFRSYFEKPLKECLSSKEMDIKKEIELNLNFSTKNTTYNKWIEEHFINQLLEKEVFCIILLLPLLSKDFVRKNYIEFLEGQLAKAEEIFRGIYELAKNIVEHSGTDGTIVVKTTTKDILLKENKKNHKLWNKYFNTIEDLDYCDDAVHTYLDILVTDNGTNDIIETTIKNLSKPNWRGIPEKIRRHDIEIIQSKLKDCNGNKDEEAELLFDMYFSGENPLNLNRQANSSYKGQGIYLFTEFITSNKGFFNVETNSNSSGTTSTINFSCMNMGRGDSIVEKNTIINEEQKTDPNLFGTTYKIILPITKGTLYENETLAETPEYEEINFTKGIYEKMLPLKKEQIKPKDKEYKNLLLNELASYDLPKYVIRDYIANENKILVLSLKNKKQRDFPIDRTIVYRDISQGKRIKNFPFFPTFSLSY